jgi:hypothetical protein
MSRQCPPPKPKRFCVRLPSRGRLVLIARSLSRWSVRLYWPFGDPTKNIPSRIVFATRLNLGGTS